MTSFAVLGSCPHAAGQPADGIGVCGAAHLIHDRFHKLNAAHFPVKGCLPADYFDGLYTPVPKMPEPAQAARAIWETIILEGRSTVVLIPLIFSKVPDVIVESFFKLRIFSECLGIHLPFG